MSPALNLERSFAQRTSGVIKKANEVKNRFPKVKISVYISDGTDTLVYQSDDNWPPAMEDTVAEIKAGEGQKQLIYGPTDFITVSHAIRAATTLGYGTNCHTGTQIVQESSGLGQPTLDSASLAVLKHIAPSISTEHSTPPPPPKRARIATRSTTKHQ